MPNFGSLQIDDQILNAIRDNRLVIFAGAGVSMGDPANLPSFSDLAEKIAVGTSLAREVDEPTDRFLGRLEHSQVKVHQVGAQRLSDSASEPTALHMNLMRLFGNPESVRLVTTNFDLLFEAAAKTVFERSPDIYRAPALPRGHDFRGLVHIHGDINCPREMVLTDADFGRGYITEGWAQRFLVDVFKNNTVLFVGYSHNDVVMHYLARALPPNKDVSRYALSEGEGSWKLLGITPILFCKGTDGNNFQELYDGIQCLAERVTRGILLWQSRLTQIGSQTPPIDDETIGEIEQAFREVHTTRFLTDVMREPEWPTWLDTRKHLDKLFDNATLTERDQLLARWLAKHYAIDHADELIQIIAARKMRLNPDFWHALGREVGINDENMLDNNALSRWTSILLANVPTHPSYCYVLAMVAARCAKQNNVKIALDANSGSNWTRIPRQTGQPFHGKLDTDSRANWTVK